MIATAQPPLNSTPALATNLPYVVLRLKQQQLAVCCDSVRQMLVMPEVFAVPMGPPDLRGVINVRGEVMPLIDLRVRLGLKSSVQETHETIAMLQEREQDHRNWLTELLNSVKEKRPFTLARDPHQCKFGKWYDSYKPENRAIAFLMSRFDTPHRAIHAIADTVGHYVARGEYDKAHALIESTRTGELQEMIRLFEEMRLELQRSCREVAVVLRRERHLVAVSADEVVAIETLDSDTVKPLTELTYVDSALTPEIARRRGSDQVVLLVDCDQLFKSSHAAMTCKPLNSMSDG